MKRADHLMADKFFWDEEYNDVHQWIDEHFKYHAGRKPYRHWLERHNIEAIEKQYGNFTKRFNAGYMHILCDYLSHFGVAFVPKDRKEAEEMLKSLEVLGE